MNRIGYEVVKRSTLYSSIFYLCGSLFFVHLASICIPAREYCFVLYIDFICLSCSASIQLILLFCYLLYQRMSWSVFLITLILVLLLRGFSNGISILAMAMVLGREMSNNLLKN